MNLPFLCISAAVVLISVAIAPRADAPDWRFEKSQDGVEMYSRAVEGWSIREIRGVTTVAGRLAAVAAIVDDISALPELNDIVSEARVVERDSETSYRFYCAMGMPWPVSDRDIVYQRTIAQDAKTLVVTISDRAIEGTVPARKGFVRMLKADQTWTLTPGTDGEIRVELRVLADPAGPIPSSIVNAMSSSAPLKTLQRLRRAASSLKYAGASLPYVKESQSKAVH